MAECWKYAWTLVANLKYGRQPTVTK